MTCRHVACSVLIAGVCAHGLCGCGDAVGDVRVRANGVNEARDGIVASATADGWAVELDHAVLSLVDFRMRTSAGEEAVLDVEPAVIELVPSPDIVFEVEGVPAQRWDETSYHIGPPTDASRNLGVDDAILGRMLQEGWSTYYAGRLVAPSGTVDPDGAPITQIEFELGIPAEVDYRLCVNGIDGTNGVVVPINSAADVEVTWHLTHLFFDSFVEDAALRVEPFAGVWDGQGVLTLDDLDVPLGGLRAADGGPLIDELGNPVLYIPGMTGADTLREFIVQGRPGHFNGLEGFCTTELRVGG